MVSVQPARSVLAAKAEAVREVKRRIVFSMSRIGFCKFGSFKERNGQVQRRGCKSRENVLQKTMAMLNKVPAFQQEIMWHHLQTRLCSCKQVRMPEDASL